MEIPFWKMHGAGNDFILVDDRAGVFPASDSAWIARTARRRTGVGSDGVILIQHSEKSDFRMRFFNPDGREADMCGNGARCVARLANELGAAPARMTIETAAGELKAAIEGESVRVLMTPPSDWRMDRTLVVGGQTLHYGFVNSGVPHVVIPVEDLAKVDVQKVGAAVRYHRDFAPAGTNADFVKVTGPQSLGIRTYERGVEAETLACGTGIVAAALISARGGCVKPPVQVTSAGGDVLTIDFKLTAKGAEGVSMLGPAVHVFRGVLQYQG
jgi:diaminopimelate epimerase